MELIFDDIRYSEQEATRVEAIAVRLEAISTSNKKLLRTSELIFGLGLQVFQSFPTHWPCKSLRSYLKVCSGMSG